ncbi:hypothetical protein FLONG3_509 [Fusarium longipes]|uniref:Ecp2 effector protein domain-containing protein n=1 Tax=Fusarium longipes TaxID=694270 RepID=A0A395TAV9_9HYPO|nr:hypothetical protein FLONG3_509 [Fusarium longipes]
MMLFKYLLSALLASYAVASPVPDISQSKDDLVLFKRDSILDARDLELAEIHGVNLTKMYKHSMFKRDDGDHIIIWVARSFEEHEDETLTKRQGARPGRESNYRTSPNSDYCNSHKRQNHAGPNGPYSGGVQAMYRWANSNRGVWPVMSDWENLMIAGSNSGANAVYRARTLSSIGTGIGTMDVRNDADWTQYRAREFSGRGWRASSKGGESCNRVRINYEIVKTDLRY